MRCFCTVDCSVDCSVVRKLVSDARTSAARPGLLLCGPDFCCVAWTSAARPDWAFSGVFGKSVPPEEEIFREITGSVKGIWAFRGFLENFVPLFV